MKQSMLIGLATDRGTSMLRSLGSGFRHKQESFSPAELLLWFLLAVMLFVGLAWLARALARRDRRQRYHSPRALFRSLCRAHQLDRNSRRLMKSLATDLCLDDPAQLFLLPDHMAADDLSATLKSRGAELAALQKKLFGSGLRERTDLADPLRSVELALESSHN